VDTRPSSLRIDWSAVTVGQAVKVGQLLATGRLDCPAIREPAETRSPHQCCRDEHHAGQHAAIDARGRVVARWGALPGETGHGDRAPTLLSRPRSSARSALPRSSDEVRRWFQVIVAH